jgi:hypothetical protein
MNEEAYDSRGEVVSNATSYDTDRVEFWGELELGPPYSKTDIH